MLKRIIACACCFCLLLSGAWAQEAEMQIVLGESVITVNGAEITEDVNADVYLAYQVETHEDVPKELEGLANRVVTITEAGSYRVSGTASDAQIAVRAAADDAVRIILDGADITCRTAPAIAVYTALETATAGEYGVTIELAEGSGNVVTGSHTEEIHEDDIKLSGAVSSLVSIGFEGDGYLEVNGDNEGIEVKFGHMTFNGGNIIVTSGDDPLNASEDNVSVITVNDGTLHIQVRPEKGGEGDGMDSNGSIVINGGMVASYAHPDSMDSGIDSDLGCTINGGIVLGAGNMYDEISADSEQLFMALQFAQKVNEMIVVTDTQGNLVAVCHPVLEGEDAGYTSFVFSSPDIPEGVYHLYLGGELELQDGKMIYTPGTQLQHGGAAAGQGWGMMQPPGGMGDFSGMPEGEMPWNMEGAPEMPWNMDEMPDMGDMPRMNGMPEWSQDGMPADMGGRGFGGMGGPGGMGSSAESATTEFVLSRESTGFTNITPVE